MKTENEFNKQRDIIFACSLILLICLIALFNYIIDPYYIFRDSTIKGFNNVKIHKYTNRRTIIYSDIKINGKNKLIAFTGNCLLSHYGKGLDEIAFFTLPKAEIEEITQVIKSIHKLSPNIKKIYWGLYYDDFYNNWNKEIKDFLPEKTSKIITYKDLINLFFSWNTTKYSIQTIINSIKNNGEDIKYIYPYREIVYKKYKEEINYEDLNKIKEIKDYAQKNNIELIIYYSPIHVSKKIDIYEKGKWESNQELKRRLAQITPYYDYSLFNEYNNNPLDETSKNYIDNVHPTDEYNNIVLNDLLTNKQIAKYIDSNNIEYNLENETKLLLNYIKAHKDLSEKIKKLKDSDANTKLLRKNF